MRKIIHFLIFIVIVFFINVIFYYVSEDYQFFLKKVKEPGNIIHDDKVEIKDDTLTMATSVPSNNAIKVEKDNRLISFIEVKETKYETETVLGKNYKDILNIFSGYDLKKIELNSNLFDLTGEYPDPYFEYYSQDVTLYFFPTKTYSEVHDIFSLLEEELPIELNEVNNFLDKSFYINLEKDIDDKFVRLVMKHKAVVFGLKIKKDHYNDVRYLIQTLNNPKEGS